MLRIGRSAGAAALAVGLLGAPEPARAQEAGVDLAATLARVGAQLEEHFERSQRIVANERVSVRSYDRLMQLSGLPRTLEYERRVEWESAGDGSTPVVTVRRELLAINGRAPAPGDENPCLAPETESADPLSMFLPARQGEFDFSLVDLETVDGRLVARLGYAPRVVSPGEVDFAGECVRIDLEGWYGGDAWVDVATGEVLRLDERLLRRFEYRDLGRTDLPRRFVLERDSTSIRYERVAFADPEESLMLPRSIERSWAIEGGGLVPRYFRSQQFSNYRRFVTDGRLILPEP